MAVTHIYMKEGSEVRLSVPIMEAARQIGLLRHLLKMAGSPGGNLIGTASPSES